MSNACLAPNGMNAYRGNGPATRLLVGTAQGVNVMERKPGAEWSVVGKALEGLHVSSLAIDPVRNGVFAGIHQGGVHYSADFGRTWEERSAGIGIPHVYSLGCAVEDGSPVLYAGTEPVGLFRSRDDGRSWEQLKSLNDVDGQDKWEFPMPPHHPHVKSIAFDARDPRVIYVGVEQAGLFKTMDGGKTWRELDSYWTPEDVVYRDIHQVVPRPNHPDEIYFTSGMGLYRSRDGGETWNHLTYHDFRIGYPDKLLFSPLDDRTMYMCGAFGNPGTWIRLHTANSTVMVSRDLGENWTPAHNGLPEPLVANLEAMSAYGAPGAFSLFGGTTDGCVYCSDDGGANWRRIAEGLAPLSKAGHFKLLLPGARSRRDPPPQPHA